MPPNESGRLMAPRKRPWTVARLVLARLDRLGSRIVALREVADAEDRLKRLSVGREAVEVDDHCIRIRGSKDVLERAVLAGQAAAEPGSQMSTRWRASRNKTANTYTIEIPL